MATNGTAQDNNRKTAGGTSARKNTVKVDATRSPKTRLSIPTRSSWLGRILPATVAALSRLVVAVVAYTLVVVTAISILPQFAAWLHQVSGLSVSEVTLSGLFGLWCLPLVFIAAVLGYAEIALIRWAWRTVTRRYPWAPPSDNTMTMEERGRP